MLRYSYLPIINRGLLTLRFHVAKTQGIVKASSKLQRPESARFLTKPKLEHEFLQKLTMTLKFHLHFV